MSAHSWCQDVILALSLNFFFFFLLDFLRSAGESSQHHGLAGLAEVLQHPSIWPRSEFHRREKFERNMCSGSI